MMDRIRPFNMLLAELDRMRLFNMLLAELPACLTVRNGEDVQIGVDPEKLMALVDRILAGENHDDGTG